MFPLVSDVTSAVIVILRTFALYQRDRRVLIFMLAVGAVLFSISCVSLRSVGCAHCLA